MSVRHLHVDEQVVEYSGLKLECGKGRLDWLNGFSKVEMRVRHEYFYRLRRNISVMGQDVMEVSPESLLPLGRKGWNTQV